MSRHENPDLVISVDFGTTHTSRSTSNEFQLSLLTWGPARFVQPPNRMASDDSITGILLGNGIIQPASEVNNPSNLPLHWSREISPIQTSAKAANWKKDAIVRIAGGDKVNENCQADLKLLWPLFTQALENLGAYQEYWAFTEFQAGVAIAGQQFGGQLQFTKPGPGMTATVGSKTFLDC
jgi:hypothetical protein